MADSEFSIKFSAETGEFSREMEKLRGQLGDVVSKPEDVEKFISKLTELRDLFASLIDKYVALEDESRSNTQALRDQLDALAPNAKGYEQRKAAIEAQIQASQRHTDELHANVDALTAQRDALAQTAAQSGKSARAFFETTQQLDKADTALNEYGEKLTKVTAEHQKANTEVRKFIGTQKDAVKGHQDASKAADVETRYNELLAMSRRELVAEMRRVGQERKMAAARGETEEVARLNKEWGLARKALRALNQQKTLNRMLYLQQAQAATTLVNSVQGLSQSFAKLGDAAKNGTLNLSGLTQNIISLGFAVKAGLGPLGAIVAAIEVATKIWNAYAAKQREVREATIAAYEAFRKLDDARLNAAMQRRKQLLDDETQATQRAIDAAKRESDIVINENKRALSSLQQQNEQAVRQRAAEQQAEEQKLARNGTALQLEEMRRRHALELQQMKADGAAAERALQQATANEQKEVADKALSEQKRLSDGMRKGYAKLLDIGFTEKDRSTIEHYFRQIDSLAEQRSVTQAQIEGNKKKVDKFIKENESAFDEYGRQLRSIIGYDDADENGKYIARQKRKQKRLEESIVTSLQTEDALNKEIELLYPDILKEVGKLKQAEGLSASAKFRLYFDIKKQVETAERQTEAAEEAAKSAESEAENLDAADKAAKKLAEQDEKNARAAAESALAQTALAQTRKKIDKATKTSGTYTERDTRQQYDILQSDRERLQMRLRARRAERKALIEAGGDRAKVEALNEEIVELKKSIRGVNQQINDSVPQLIKELREGITPPDMVALNPDKQGDVERVAKLMSQHGVKLEKLYRKRADAQRRAEEGDKAAAHEVELYNKEINKSRKLLAKDAEGVNKRVVGGTAGTELFDRITSALRAEASGLTDAAKQLKEKRTDEAKERQKKAEAGIAAQLEEQERLLAAQNEEARRVLDDLKKTGGAIGFASFAGRVLSASEQIVEYLNQTQNDLKEANRRIATLEAKLNGLGGKIKNLAR